MKYVIIGNSTAAIAAVEGIRQVDRQGEITIISKEEHHTYSRPLISYYIGGKIDGQRMKYRPDNFYADNNVSFLGGTEAKAIDRERKLVMLSDKRQIGYDKLLIATGSTPFVPPFKGLEKVNKYHTFYTFNDALELEKELAPNKKILIVGGGLIGLKCAEGVYGKAAKITVVDKSHKLLSSILDDEGSQIVKELLEKKGISLKLSADLTHFEEKAAYFVDGSCEEFDILVIAIGVRGNTALAKDSGLTVNQGVLIDAHMRTNDENIYSAGDCAEGYDMLLEKKRVLALLPNAYFQGETAGRNMAGRNEEYVSGIPMNAIGLFGLHMVSAGVYEGESVTKRTASSYKRLFFNDNRLKGFIIIGDCGRAGIYTSLIREKIPLSEIDFRLITDRPQLIALNKKLLSKKLGGNL